MTPTPEQVKQARKAVQASQSIGITSAQDWCASALHTSRRSFQQWEVGDRTMHPAFWELLGIKLAMLNAHNTHSTANTLKSG